MDTLNVPTTLLGFHFRRLFFVAIRWPDIHNSTINWTGNSPTSASFMVFLRSKGCPSSSNCGSPLSTSALTRWSKVFKVSPANLKGGQLGSVGVRYGKSPWFVETSHTIPCFLWVFWVVALRWYSWFLKMEKPRL